MADMAGVRDLRSTVTSAIPSGRALDKFRQMVEQQGGDPRVVDNYSLLPTAPNRTTVTAPRAGFVADIDPFAVGVAVAHLGGGRLKDSDAIDPAVGVIVKAKRGERVSAGEPVFEVHHRGETGLREATELLRGCFRISEEPPVELPLILEELR
jgi:pyrimidine-nucleoside phosphorylase